MWRREPKIEEIISAAVLFAIIALAAFVGMFLFKYHYDLIPWFLISGEIVSIICSVIMFFWWMDLKELKEADEERAEKINKNIVTYKVVYYVSIGLYFIFTIGQVYYYIFSIF